MKYLVGVLLSLAFVAATTASKLAVVTKEFEKCKNGSELIETPQCPEVDPEEPVYFPFPDDCEQYYQCSNGIARCLKCAPGTVWDQLNLICNHPDATNCPVVTTEKPTTEGPPENVICDKEVAGLFAHPDKCSLFILCDPGRLPCIIECPEGTCFNNDTNTCEYPNKNHVMGNNVATARERVFRNVFQRQVLNYRNIKRDNFAEAVQFVANTLTNRLNNRQVENNDNDSCEMLNYYVRNA